MMFIYGLRLISDLAFYFFFANSILNSQLLAVFPALVYTIYLIASKKLDTDWDRQSDFFSKSWKIFFLFGSFICLIGKSQIFVQRSIPMAIVCLTASILLMRMLRHGPDIYLDKKYQAKNILFLCSILGATFILSSQFMRDIVLNFFGFMYHHLLVPILTLMISCLTGMIALIMKSLSFLHLTDIAFEESHLSGSSDTNPLKDSIEGAMAQSTNAQIIFSILGMLILLTAIFFLFRWLASRSELDNKHVPGILLSREELPDKHTERSTSTVNQVRRQYRKYLKLCKSYGTRISKSDTSASIEAQSSSQFGCSSENTEIRNIYLSARYNNHATKSDLKKLKQMYQTLKQKL